MRILYKHMQKAAYIPPLTSQKAAKVDLSLREYMTSIR